MTAEFEYYELAHLEEGVGSGFRYETAPHISLKSIANNPEIREGMTREQIDAAIARYADQETLYDQPYTDKSRVRVTGPFTVEAVPAPTVRSLENADLLTEDLKKKRASNQGFWLVGRPDVDVRKIETAGSRRYDICGRDSGLRLLQHPDGYYRIRRHL
jgi:hypothetical protein